MIVGDCSTQDRKERHHILPSTRVHISRRDTEVEHDGKHTLQLRICLSIQPRVIQRDIRVIRVEARSRHRSMTYSTSIASSATSSTSSTSTSAPTSRRGRSWRVEEIVKRLLLDHTEYGCCIYVKYESTIKSELVEWRSSKHSDPKNDASLPITVANSMLSTLLETRLSII